MKINFCTFLDKKNISRFIVLKQSLENFNLNYKFYVLCLDNFTLNFFKKNFFRNLEIITFEQIKKKYSSVNFIKDSSDIKRKNFLIFTFLINYIYEVKKQKQISYITPDCFFYKNPEKLILTNMDASLLVVRKNIYVKDVNFNINFISFNFYFNETKKILNHFSLNCINYLSNSKLSNSTGAFEYLSNWVSKLKNIRILQPEYSCLGPWENNKVIEHNINLIIIFNFHKLKINNKSYSTGFFYYNKRASKKIIKNLYKPYIKKLLYIENKYNLKFLASLNENKNFLIKFFLRLKIFIYTDHYKLIK